MEREFTSELFDYKTLRGMFLTLALDQFSIIFLNVICTALVSSVGEAAIAAVSMVSVVNSMMALIFGGIATGGGIVIARAKGSGDVSRIRRAIADTTNITFLSATVLSLLMTALSEPLTKALYPTAEPLLIEYAVHYMRWIMMSFIPFSFFSAFFSSFRSLGDTRSSLFLTIVINGVHLICSIIYINGFHLGVTGAGMSFFTARVVGMIVSFLWQMKVHNEYGLQWKDFFHIDRAVTKSILNLGSPIAMESVLMQGGMLIVQVYLARLTTTDLAAHAVANSILTLVYSTGNGMNALVGTVCGQCYGAKKYELLKHYCVRMIQAGRVVLLTSVLVVAPFLQLLLKMYHATEAGTPIIVKCLAVAAIAVPAFWSDSYLPPLALRSAGDSMFTTVVSVLSLLIGRCAVGYILTIPLRLGVPGVWLGMSLEWLLRGIALRIRFSGNHWLHMPKTVAAE